jgi:hypothetical protein
MIESSDGNSSYRKLSNGNVIALFLEMFGLPDLRIFCHLDHFSGIFKLLCMKVTFTF